MSFVAFGEIMLRLAAPGQVKLQDAVSMALGYAGSESNVATSLSILGNQVEFVSKLPQNPLGDGAVRSLHSYGISTRHLLRGGNRLGTYFIELGSSIRPSRVLYDRAGSSISQISPGEINWEKVLPGNSWVFISGITPALSDQCASETIRLASTAQKLGVKVGFDLNFRRTLWTDPAAARAIFDQVLEHTDLLIGNAGAIADVYGVNPVGETPMEIAQSAIHMARERFGGSSLAFTVRDHNSASRNSVSAVLYDGKSFFTAAGYSVDILDRFGTGDAFAAGVLHGLYHGWDSQLVIDFATAAFALKHTIPGDQHTSTQDEIRSVMEGYTSGQVIR